MNLEELKLLTVALRDFVNERMKAVEGSLRDFVGKSLSAHQEAIEKRLEDQLEAHSGIVEKRLLEQAPKDGRPGADGLDGSPGADGVGITKAKFDPSAAEIVLSKSDGGEFRFSLADPIKDTATDVVRSEVDAVQRAIRVDLDTALSEAAAVSEATAKAKLDELTEATERRVKDAVEATLETVDAALVDLGAKHAEAKAGYAAKTVELFNRVQEEVETIANTAEDLATAGAGAVQAAEKAERVAEDTVCKVNEVLAEHEEAFAAARSTHEKQLALVVSGVNKQVADLVRAAEEALEGVGVRVKLVEDDLRESASKALEQLLASGKELEQQIASRLDALSAEVTKTAPVCREYVEHGEYLMGEMVTVGNRVYQATRKTTRHYEDTSAWVLVVKGPEHKGTFSAEAKYLRGDIVAFNKGAWIAKCDSPGPLPGAGWQLMVARGEKGSVGEPGLAGRNGSDGTRGEQGSPGVGIASVTNVGLKGIIVELTNGEAFDIPLDLEDAIRDEVKRQLAEAK